MLWISYRNFSFHNAIRFRPVERTATRSLPHSKRLDNMEHLVTSQLHEVATCFLRLQINLFLTSFFGINGLLFCLTKIVFFFLAKPSRIHI